MSAKRSDAWLEQLRSVDSSAAREVEYLDEQLAAKDAEIEQAKYVAAIAELNEKECLAKIASQDTEIARLHEAVEAMLQAVCGESGFANAVRKASGIAYPWPALDLAEENAITALKRKGTPNAR